MGETLPGISFKDRRASAGRRQSAQRFQALRHERGSARVVQRLLRCRLLSLFAGNKSAGSCLRQTTSFARRIVASPDQIQPLRGEKLSPADFQVRCLRISFGADALTGSFRHLPWPDGGEKVLRVLRLGSARTVNEYTQPITPSINSRQTPSGVEEWSLDIFGED